MGEKGLWACGPRGGRPLPGHVKERRGKTPARRQLNQKYTVLETEKETGEMSAENKKEEKGGTLF